MKSKKAAGPAGSEASGTRRAFTTEVKTEAVRLMAARRAASGRGRRERIEKVVDHFEHGALLGGRELGEALDALEEPGDLGTGRVAERGKAEELIGRDLGPRATSRRAGRARPPVGAPSNDNADHHRHTVHALAVPSAPGN